MNILRWMWTWGVPVWGFQKLLELFQLLSVCVWCERKLVIVHGKLLPLFLHLDKYKMKCKEPFMSGKKAGSICKPTQYTVKKRWAGFPSPAGMSLTKLFLVGNNLIIPGQGEFWLVTSCLGLGNKLTFFHSVLPPCRTPLPHSCTGTWRHIHADQHTVTMKTSYSTRTCTKMDPHTCTGTMQSCRPPLHYPLLALGSKFVLVNPIQLLKPLYPSASVTLII